MVDDLLNGWAGELYAEVVEDDDVAGDLSGREGLKD
jgi:hypothetical protein